VTAPAPGELEVTEAGVTPIACPVVDGIEALGINIYFQKQKNKTSETEKQNFRNRVLEIKLLTRAALYLMFAKISHCGR
jgi:hypothetical protein